jgi:hypothetical protein
MPVVYVAVGRRLGYRLKLVEALGASGHLFARWDEPAGERFNIEGTNRGLNCHPDDYYRTGYFRPTQEFEQRCRLLKSMTPREELACFLHLRGSCWRQAGSVRNAVESFGYAFGLAPDNRFYEVCFALGLGEWRARLERLKPPGFPEVRCRWPPTRRLPAAVPWEMEKEFLALLATQIILACPEWARDWWGPMRRGERLSVRPERADVSFTGDGCKVRLLFGPGRQARLAARSADGLQWEVCDTRCVAG